MRVPKGSLGDGDRPIRLAYLVSHPIQYQAPLLRLIAEQRDIDLTVFFQSDISTRAYHDVGFGRTVEWDTPLLDGYRYEYLPALGGMDKVTSLRPLSYGLGKRLEAGAFDVLWIHGYARLSNWAAIRAARKRSIPVLIRDEAHALSGRRTVTKMLMKRVFFGLLNKYCSGFLAIGEWNKNYFLENGIEKEKIFSVPYCVDNKWFSSQAQIASVRRENFRNELGLTAGRPIILYASKLQERKKPHDLLAAFAKIIAKGALDPAPYLLVVGDGVMKSSLQEQAVGVSEHVRFLGFRQQSELPPLFDLCDVFVLPSEMEPWGLIVNEVMNASKAIIVSDQVGCGPDLVKNDVNGYRYNAGKVEELAEALVMTLKDKNKCIGMGAESLRIISNWSFEQDLSGLRNALAAVV